MASEPGVKRRWPDTLVLAAIGVGLLFWAKSLWADHGFGAFVVSIVGVMIAGFAVVGPASGPCPLCGKELHGLYVFQLGMPTRCDYCQLYFVPDQKQAALPDDYVSATPMFPVPVSTEKPGMCCVCAKPATKVKEFYHKSEGRVSHASPLVQKLEVRAPMPYCNEHTADVELGSHNFHPSQTFLEMLTNDKTSTGDEMVLKVRSYKFYRAAWGIN